MLILRCGVLLLSIAAAANSQEPASFSERQNTPVGRFTIEHDPADGEYVRALSQQLQRPELLAAAPEAAPPFGFEQLAAQREQILQEIAQLLGSARPSADLQKMYDRFVHWQSVLQKTVRAAAPRRFALWRKADLVARLRAGQKIPGFELEPDGQVAIRLRADFDASPEITPEVLAATIDDAWGTLTWPVKIGEQSPEADIAASLDALRNFKGAMSQNEASLSMVTLHETVEVTLVGEVIRSADRRWFCEGVANYVALEVIGRRVAPELLRRYYDVEALIAKAGDAANSDLEKWAVAGSAEARHMPGEISEVNYARATRVIQRASARHPQLLSRWLSELRKTPPDKQDMAGVHAAFRKVTGEGLREYLEAR
jgi:hypothetical protein